MNRLTLLLLPFALLVAGCITKPLSNSSGTAISSDKVAQIQKGKTTRAEIEALFGKPTNVGMMGDGKRTMTYSFFEMNGEMKIGLPILPFVGNSTRTQGTQRTQTLQIVLNKDGIVDDFEFSDSTKNMNNESSDFRQKTSTS